MKDKEKMKAQGGPGRRRGDVAAPERGALRGGGRFGARKGGVKGGRFGARNPPQGLNIHRVLMFRV